MSVQPSTASLPDPDARIGRTVHLLGTLITFRATAADTGGAFSLVEAVTAPGQGTPAHVQREDAEAFHVLEGSFDFRIGGRPFAADLAASTTFPKACRTASAIRATRRPAC